MNEVKHPPRVHIRHCKEGCMHFTSYTSLGVQYLSISEHKVIMGEILKIISDSGFEEIYNWGSPLRAIRSLINKEEIHGLLR